MIKAIFLDRDGTINVDMGFTCDIKDLQFLPGAEIGLKRMIDMGFELFIITNQSGIGRGYYTEDDFWRFMEEMQKILAEKGIYFKKIYFCPHHPTDAKGKYKVQCKCRKPLPGMIEIAKKEFDIDISNSWMIGDSLRDVQAGKSAGLRTILITQKSVEDNEYINFCARDLIEAAKIIYENKDRIIN